MPWEVTGPVKERTRFIEAYLTGFYTLSELSERAAAHSASDGGDVAEKIIAFRRRAFAGGQEQSSRSPKGRRATGVTPPRCRRSASASHQS